MRLFSIFAALAALAVFAMPAGAYSASANNSCASDTVWAWDTFGDHNSAGVRFVINSHQGKIVHTSYTYRVYSYQKGWWTEERTVNQWFVGSTSDTTTRQVVLARGRNTVYIRSVTISGVGPWNLPYKCHPPVPAGVTVEVQ